MAAKKKLTNWHRQTPMRNCWSSLKKVKEESSESAERIQPSFRRETFLRRRDAFLLEFSIRIKYWSNNPSAIDRKLCRTIRWPTMNYENCRAINIFHRDKLVPCTKTAVVCKQRRFLFWTKISEKQNDFVFSLRHRRNHFSFFFSASKRKGGKLSQARRFV